jgi:hypothetical protein
METVTDARRLVFQLQAHTVDRPVAPDFESWPPKVGGVPVSLEAENAYHAAVDAFKAVFAERGFDVVVAMKAVHAERTRDE